jgi:hypothetical protein
MRIVYLIVFLLGTGAVLADHLTSPSTGRVNAPDAFAGACAPCGAPCPSTQKK